jgi:DNA-binding transcriptional regulator YiaG
MVKAKGLRVTKAALKRLDQLLEGEDQDRRLGDLKAVLKATGMTKSAFARAIEVDVRTVRRWLEGTRKIDGPTGTLFYVMSLDPKAVVESLPYGPE